MTDAPKPTLDEIRARKAAVKAENLARVSKEVEPLLAPLPERMSFNDLQIAHGRLRQKIVEIQTLAIQGQFDFAKAQDFERILVGRIHEVEERARSASSGRHVPRPGE